MPAPLKYTPDIAKQAEKLCSLGATETEVAAFFEVDRKTLWRWRQDFPELAEAIRVGKEHADERVVQSLYCLATGERNEDGTWRTKPDTTACIFWLKNRRPDEWRDVKGVEHSGAIRHEHVEELSDADLERIAAGGRPGTAKKANGKKEPAAIH